MSLRTKTQGVFTVYAVCCLWLMKRQNALLEKQYSSLITIKRKSFHFHKNCFFSTSSCKVPGWNKTCLMYWVTKGRKEKKEGKNIHVILPKDAAAQVDKECFFFFFSPSLCDCGLSEVKRRAALPQEAFNHRGHTTSPLQPGLRSLGGARSHLVRPLTQKES